MKKLLFYFIILTILIACNRKIELNRKNLNSIPKYLIQTIQERDTLNFLKLFDFQLDPNINDSTAIKNLNLKNFQQVYEIFKDKKVEYLKYDTLDGLNGGEIIDNESLNIYVKVDNNYYKLRLTHHTVKKENYFLIFYLNDLTFECNSIFDKPYQPETLFTHLNWDSFNGYVFNNVNAVFNNLTEYDIEEIKFRLTIKNSDKIIFHQTIFSKGTIYKGDLKDITINELQGVNAGFPLREGNFEWNIDVLEVEPKPEINPCAKIENLKGVK